MLGRLKRTLKKRCPECGGILQLRVENNSVLVKGVEIIDEKDYIYCPTCEYENHNHINKKQDNNKKKVLGDDIEYKKREPIKNSNGRNNKRSY